MPDIQLHDYLLQIDDWIRSGEQDRAIAHGRHVLRRYPDCVAVHTLLGEAYLETGMYSEAQDCFERTLAADPESAISHYGLALICDRQGKLPEAIWYLERAFDLAAGNAEVRAELQKLYARRDGRQRDGPALTSAAMGRVYAHNDMLERAIAEYEDASGQSPELLYVRTGLAEAQWRTGRSQEAMQTCTDLLGRLPGCLKALLILGGLLMQAGQESEAQPRLALAQRLDPENRLAQELMGERSPLPLTEVLIPELGKETPEEISPGGEALAPAEMEAPPSTQELTTPAEAVIAEAPAPEEERAQPDVDGAGAVPSEADLAVETTPEEPPAEEVVPVDTRPERLEELPRIEVRQTILPASDEAEPVPGRLESWEAAGSAAPSAESEAEGTPEEAAEPPAWLAGLPEQPVAAEEPAEVPALAEEQAARPAIAEEVEPVEPAGKWEPVEPAAEVVAAPGPPGAPELEAAGPSAEAAAAAAEEVPDWVRHMEEAVSQEGGPVGADALSGTATATGASAMVRPAIPPTVVGEQVRERMVDLLIQLQDDPRKYWARIELARLCGQAHDWDGALLHYEELIASRKMVRAAIQDLQGLLQEQVDRVQVYRLLGDAYMETDEIDQALEMYRLARQILRRR
jgi:tetratricopeptide (TPR) repeat protein